MSLQELETFGLTTGVKKVLKLLDNADTTSVKRKIPASKPKATKAVKIEGSKSVMDAFLGKKKA